MADPLISNVDVQSEENEVTNTELTQSFKLDRSKISQSALVDQLPLLAEIGVAAYDQDTFEAGVLEQVDDAFRQTSTSQLISTGEGNEKNKDLDNADGDSKTVESVSSEFAAPTSSFISPREMIFQSTSSRIKFGDATPFDLLEKSQSRKVLKKSVVAIRKASIESKKSNDGEDDIVPDGSGSEYVPSDSAEEEDEEEDEEHSELYSDEPSNSLSTRVKRKGAEPKKRKEKASLSRKLMFLPVKDDGSEKVYKNRLKEWKTQQLHDRLVRSVGNEDSSSASDFDDVVELTGGLKIPTSLWDKLYPYQKTGVRWLWDLHSQAVGGIIGDEMGLGKTIQIIVFLAALDYSKLPSLNNDFNGLGPVVIVTPTTVMHQWVREFHHWWPPLRVVVLHESGSYTGSRADLVRHVAQSGGVLITSYSTLTLERDLLLKYDWHYIILDEGHKIRNPDARVTVAAKRFRTPHRLILSGTPMQNSLKELWSLFDFVYPGRLGALPVFLREFGVPITQGGYANATDIQVRTAYRCACVLRDAISPYLLRRLKSDVQQTVQLPSKNEQVLFCRLTDEQRMYYRYYLQSRECDSILRGSLEVFVGLIALRKLCNHPDLLTGGPNRLGDIDETEEPSAAYGYPDRSGKMMVVKALLKLWQSQGHRVLLFSQSKQMLNVLETFVRSEGYVHLRMDGGTPIGSRQNLVTKFNNDPSIFVFLLTTRVGGLGLNLIGADRVLIYDPDWNPSTDAQARERVWRIGQQRPVTIYRLITAGTIEEKIYHRQIFKQFLTNRVLKDPRQRRFFKTNDLYELFTLGDDSKEGGTETGSLFAGMGTEINKAPRKRKHSSVDENFFDRLADERGRQAKRTRSDGKRNFEQVDEEDIDYVPETAKEESRQLSEDRRKQLMEMAKKISRRLGSSDVDTRGISAQGMEKKRRHRHKDSKLDGVKIPGLMSHTDYRPPGSGADDQEKVETSSKNHDDYVLRKLFKKSGIHSALRHDKIINDSDADYTLVEAEAESVAKRASEALEASRRLVSESTARPGVLTWTGRHGEAGMVGNQSSRPRFGPKPKMKLSNSNGESTTTSAPVTERPLFCGLKKRSAEGLSSVDLLTEIRNRQRILPEAIDAGSVDEGNERLGILRPDGSTGPSKAVACAPRFEQLMNELRLFMVFGGQNADGRATTQEILAKFGNRIQSQDSTVFRSMLKRICDFHRAAGGEGVWILKAQYR